MISDFPDFQSKSSSVVEHTDICQRCLGPIPGIPFLPDPLHPTNSSLSATLKSHLVTMAHKVEVEAHVVIAGVPAWAFAVPALEENQPKVQPPIHQSIHRTLSFFFFLSLLGRR